MLLSLTHRFIFVANLKSASSAIERALGPHAEFRVSQTKFGKHDDLSTISRKFAFTKRYVKPSEFFVFGVVREPVDFVLSLYNFHTLESFSGKAHSSKGVPFEEFWNGWCSRSWQARSQHPRFIDKRGRLRVSHIIDFAQLASEFPKICERIGVTAKLPKANVSPPILKRSDLSPQQIEDIKQRYADDYEFLKNRPYAL
ncbi:MAG TPA: hypothetical protein VJU82_07060 [Acidobacteriaceae bacterium]|nr:hypothetical protein [Acidobacteriaceae bacterium]